MQPVSWVYCTKPCVVPAVYELKPSRLSWRVGNHAGKISSGRRLITCCDTTGRGQARKVFDGVRINPITFPTSDAPGESPTCCLIETT